MQFIDPDGMWPEDSKDPDPLFDRKYINPVDRDRLNRGDWKNGISKDDDNSTMSEMMKFMPRYIAGGNNETNSSSTKSRNGWKILKSFIQTNPTKTLAGEILQIVSRFTWQLPQQVLGVLIAETTALFGGVQSVNFAEGATFIKSKYYKHGSGLTVGSIVTTEVNPSSRVKRHEFGHTVQSSFLGPLWLPVIAAPSFIRATILSIGWNIGMFQNVDYEHFYKESWATDLGNNYGKSIK